MKATTFLVYSVILILTVPVPTGLLRSQALPLPLRASNALTGSQLVSVLTPLTRTDREDRIFDEITWGNVPDFLRTLVPVTSSASIGGTTKSVTYYVTPDYMAVGSDEDYFLTPMTPLLAQRLADALGCTLPTRKMVNDIYAAAPLKLAPAPIPPSDTMITVPVFAQHNAMVWAQRSAVLGTYPLGTLVGGTKKDVVISNKIRNDLHAGVPKPVVIYGWHQLNGSPIQPLYNGHGETYADYSHGIRLIQNAVQLDGSPTTVSAILMDPSLSALLSDEGTIPIPRYGDPATKVEEPTEAHPQGSLMFRNFPNPFNPTTTISYQLPTRMHVRVTVHDLLGRQVGLLREEREDAGFHEVSFDAERLPSGVYLCLLQAGAIAEIRKLVLVR